MKRIIAGFVFLAAIAFSEGSQAQRRTFYYYPQQNVYYNPVTHQYAYPDNGTWTYRETLPPTYTISPKRYVTVYGDRDDIWTYNNMHREKYKDWDKRNRKHRDRDDDDHRDRDRDGDRH